MTLETNWLDWLVFGLALSSVFAFGLYMSRQEKTSTDFFLAGRRLPWYAISLSLYATNISTGSIIGLAGQGYTVGMAVGMLEWHGLFGLILLAFVFLPYYQRRSLTTMPEFLELRYNLGARLLFAGGVILFDMVIGMPFFLYTGSLIIEVMFGVPLIWSVVAISTFVGLYTTKGGLGAVVWADVGLALFMLLGGALVTALGLRAIGGWEALMTQAGDHMHVVLPADHPEYPFLGNLIGGYFLVAIYYWCQNQTIVQRALGGRTEWDARMGAMVTCLIKLVLPFILVLPGVIAFVVVPGLDTPDKAFPMLVTRVVPAGFSGLIIAALIAALASTTSATINSWATLFTHDLYHRVIDKKAGHKRLILVGRLATIFPLLMGAIQAPLLRENPSVLQFFITGLAYIATPIIVVFAVGIFWRRATSAAAIVTILTAPVVCYVAQHLPTLTGWGPSQTSIVYWVPIAVAASVLLMTAVSLFTTAKAPALLEGLIWTREDTLTFGTQLFQRRDAGGADTPASRTGGRHIWSDYRLVGVLSLLLLAAVMCWLA